MVFTPRLSHSLLCVFATCLTAAFFAPGSASAQPAARKALINGATVEDLETSPSLEEQAATAQGFVVTAVPQETWAEMTQAEFGAYDLLIIGDPNCTFAPQTAAANAATWAPVVMGTAGGRTKAGNRIVIGTDPALHANVGGRPDAGIIIREGVAFAGAQVGTTGLYFSASCGGGGSNVLTALGLLSTGSGVWTAGETEDCSVSLIASAPAFATLTTASLTGWGCSVHESWETFTSDWSPLAVATGTPTHPTCGLDPDSGIEACGQAYILIAGSSIVVVSDSIAVAPLEATNPAGTTHTVTAHVTSDGVPLAGQTVTFTVTGQNAGATGTCLPAACVTDANGDVSFSYIGANGPGDDTIKASFTDSARRQQSATAQKHWLAGEGGVSGITFGDFAEDVDVHRGFDSHEDEFLTAYVAVEEAGVRILDVTDPDEITTLGSYAPATCQNGRRTATFFADDVEFVESLSALFVAAGRCGVLVLDVSNPAAPVLIGRYDTPVWTEAVQVDSSGDQVIGYIADNVGGLVIVDFTGLFQKPPTAAVRLGGIGSKAKGWGKGAALDVAVHHTETGVLVFVANSQGLRVVDATTPASPKLIGGYNTNPKGTPPSVPQDITLSDDGNTAFMASWQAGLLAIDVSDPAHPALLRQITTSTGNVYFESEIAGDRVFATEAKRGLRTFARGESGLETITGEVPIPIAGGTGWAWDVQVLEGVAYVTYGILEDGTGGLAVIELPRP